MKLQATPNVTFSILADLVQNSYAPYASMEYLARERISLYGVLIGS